MSERHSWFPVDSLSVDYPDGCSCGRTASSCTAPATFLNQSNGRAIEVKGFKRGMSTKWIIVRLNSRMSLWRCMHPNHRWANAYGRSQYFLRQTFSLSLVFFVSERVCPWCAWTKQSIFEQQHGGDARWTMVFRRMVNISQLSSVCWAMCHVVMLLYLHWTSKRIGNSLDYHWSLRRINCRTEMGLSTSGENGKTNTSDCASFECCWTKPFLRRNITLSVVFE